MIKRICLLTGNETHCTDSCYKCGCGGEAALSDFWVPLYTIQQACDNNIKEYDYQLFERIRNYLERMSVVKAADAQPIKCAKWENEYLDDDIWWAECSACKNETHSKYGRVSAYAYCPNCGAKMND